MLASYVNHGNGRQSVSAVRHGSLHICHVKNLLGLSGLTVRACSHKKQSWQLVSHRWKMLEMPSWQWHFRYWHANGSPAAPGRRFAVQLTLFIVGRAGHHSDGHCLHTDRASHTFICSDQYAGSCDQVKVVMLSQLLLWQALKAEGRRMADAIPLLLQLAKPSSCLHGFWLQTDCMRLCRWPGVVVITAITVALATVLRLGALALLFSKCASHSSNVCSMRLPSTWCLTASQS